MVYKRTFKKPINTREKLELMSTTVVRQHYQTVQILLKLGVWWSQPISASVGCGFHVQNPSDSDADLSHDQNYQLLWLL